MMNQSAADRGLFRSYVTRTYRDEEKTRGTDATRIEPPSKRTCRGLRRANYDLLHARGFVEPGTRVQPNDVLIGKTMLTEEIADPDAPVPAHVPQQRGARTVTRDNSLILRSNEPATVDCVMETTNRDGARLIKMRTRAMRRPQIGDKFCLTPDHEVLTDARGWQPIADVRVTDQVACLEHGVLQYRAPTRVYMYALEREVLYVVDASHVQLRVTLEHKMYVRTDTDTAYALLEARHCVGARAVYCNTARFEAPEYDLTRLHALYDSNEPLAVPYERDGVLRVTDGDAWLALYGAVRLYGWASHHARDDANDATLCVECRDATHATQVERACERLGFASTRVGVPHAHDDARVRVLVLHHGAAVYCAQAARPLPAWTWHLSARQCRVLLDAMLPAWERDCALLTLRNAPLLLDALQRLCLHAGYAGVRHDDTTLQVYARAQEQQQQMKVLPNEEQLELYSGAVHCLEVPEHVFLVRRAGRAVWTGNSSRHGQKGVVGILYRQEDMPFCERTGETPDVIMNPHAYPSRMTVAQLIEGLLGKAAARDGRFGDGTPFSDVRIEDIAEQLFADGGGAHEQGDDGHGKRFLIHPHTGERIEARICMAPVFYQRLKHMSLDKIHARSRGPVQLLTRQPLEGRSKDGGLRLGEMERDVILAYGASQFLHERLFEQSDAYSTVVCERCGLLAEPARHREEGAASAEQQDAAALVLSTRAALPYCRNCDRTDTVRSVKMPYVCKLLAQELGALNIAMRFVLNTTASGDATLVHIDYQS